MPSASPNIAVVGLVGCVKSKLSVPSRAADLYTSTLFRGRRAWVETNCDRWYILSAKHGLIGPDEVLAPYDESLLDMSRVDRQAWARRVLAELTETLGRLDPYAFEMHAGAAYSDFGLADGLRRAGASVSFPVHGLNFGRQLAFDRAGSHAKPGPVGTAQAVESPRPKALRDLAVAPPTAVASERSTIPGISVGVVRPLDPFSYRWPDEVEEFEAGWEAEVTLDGRAHRLRHGLGSRVVYGRERVHTVTWLHGEVQVEGVEADDYPTSQALVSRIRKPGRSTAKTPEEVPPGYEALHVVRHRVEIEAPYSPDCMAVKVREDDLTAWATHAWLRSRLRRKNAWGYLCLRTGKTG